MDFPFHPQAKFWFDHHEDPFEKPEWKEAFKPSPNHIWDSSRYSCCGLILDSLSENFGYKPPRHLKELAGWLDILDGARYKSVRQALSTKGAFLLNACVGQARKEERLFPLFVKTLSEKPISGVLKMPVVAKIARKIKTETSESMDFYRKNTKIFGNSTYVDETGLRSRPLRYAPNRLFPKMKFSVRRHADANLKGIFHFSVGFNPWMDERKLKISIRDLLAKYGGGGHRKVGGLEIRGKIKADKVEREIIDFLNKN
jgi:oligoribonuclease NrnB/cAMP/cGMP phosphodiesterase (DHH superfamily)